MLNKRLVLIVTIICMIIIPISSIAYTFSITEIPNNTIRLGDDFFDLSSDAMLDPAAAIPIQSLIKPGPNQNKAYYKFGGYWYDILALNQQQLFNPLYALPKSVVDAWTGFNKWYKAGSEVVDLTGVTTNLGIPQNLKAESGSGQVSLAWDAVTGATGYKVYMSDQMNGTYSETPVGINNYTTTGLIKGKPYYFKVKATNVITDGEFSNTICEISNIDRTGNTYGGNYLLVSNESVIPQNSEPSGSLPDVKQILSNGIEKGSTDIYPIDVHMPAPDKKEFVVKKDSGIDKSLNTQKSYTVGDIAYFNTDNILTEQVEVLSFQLKYSGTRCNLWVDTRNQNITVSMAQQMGQEYDVNIDSLIRDKFASPSDVDGDGKVSVLCFDIQDGFSGSGAYVAGYFFPYDLAPKSMYSRSNQMEVLYIDTYPGMGISQSTPDITRSYSTIVHELQHEVNFTNYLYDLTQDQPMDLWLNEALSMAAEHLYEGVQTSRISYYNISPGIKTGLSLLDWTNSTDILGNYSLSYLFSQYLWAQTKDNVSGTTCIYKEIIQDSQYDYKAVENIIHKYIDPTMSFGNFMTYFRTALVLKASSGLYGFNGMTGFGGISTPYFSGSSASLRGGGAILVPMTGSFIDSDPGDQGVDIRYIGIFN